LPRQATAAAHLAPRLDAVEREPPAGEDGVRHPAGVDLPAELAGAADERVGLRGRAAAERRVLGDHRQHLPTVIHRTVTPESEMIDPEVNAPADGGLNTAHRGRPARHQGQPALAPLDPSTLLGSCPPRGHAPPESII
jgi:hypothetical protein